MVMIHEEGACDDLRALVSCSKALALSAAKIMSKPLMNEEKASEEWESLVVVRSKGGGGGGSSSSIAERRVKTRRFKGSGTINTSNRNLPPPPSLSSPDAFSSPYRITTEAGISPTTLLDTPIMPPTISQPPITSEIPIDSPKVGASSCAAEALANTRASKSMTYPRMGGARRTCEDAYNWRRYGQKNVKTSQYPRSYYKCTLPNCKMSEASDGSGVEGEAGSDWEVGGLETSASVLTADPDPWPNSEAKLSCAIFDSDGTPELSLGDAAAAADDDESESKRRKTETSAHKPRVVVLVDSGGEALDDGYCWWKYGKKFVKGNVNPRSYYKCTSTMERASHNWKSVSITYDGKLNNEVPAAENWNVGGGWTIAPTASSTRPTLAFVRNANGPKAEAKSQDHSPFLQRMHYDLDNETVLSALFGDSKSGKKIESPAYQLKLKNSLLSCSFVPNFPMPTSPLSVSTSGSTEPSCSNVSHHGRENGFVHCCFGQHKRFWENDKRLIEPYKQEQRDDNLRGIIPRLPMVNHTNASQTMSSSSSSSSSSWSV